MPVCSGRRYQSFDDRCGSGMLETPLFGSIEIQWKELQLTGHQGKIFQTTKPLG